MARHKDLSPEAIEKRERVRKAMELRMAGATWPDIARTVGYNSKQAAQQAVDRLLDRTDVEKVGRARDLHRARIERLLLGRWRRAIAGDERAALTCIRLLDQLAKIDGLYAPTKAEITGPGGKPIAGRVDVVTWTPDETFLREFAQAVVEIGGDDEPEPEAAPAPS